MATTSHANALDPRIERSHRVVKLAALEELAAAGYGGFRIESVARRSGVAKSTIYRHWPRKLDLIVDAMNTLNVQPGPDKSGAKTTTARQRVQQLLGHLAVAVVDSPMAACLPALIEAAEHDAAVAAVLRRYSATRGQALTDAIATGIQTGEFDERLNARTAATALSGAIFYRRLIMKEPFSRRQVKTLIETVFGPDPR